MSKLRRAILIGMFVVLVCCVADLFAKPALSAACCGRVADCGATGETCCDAAYIGREECSAELTGYCMAKCIPAGGSGSSFINE